MENKCSQFFFSGLDRDRIFEDKAENFSNFSDRSVRTAKMVAVGTSTGNKKIAEALLATSGQVNIKLWESELQTKWV